MTRIGDQGAMRFMYDRSKADELAGHLLQNAGGSMPMLKLLKLMYLADRTSLIETGFPITGDAIVAMDMGPVLSNTYDRLKAVGGLGFISPEPDNRFDPRSYSDAASMPASAPDSYIAPTIAPAGAEAAHARPTEQGDAGVSDTEKRLKPSGEGFISRLPGSVRLNAPPPADGRLSDYEIGVARQVLEKFGHMSGQQLTDYLHFHAAEWKAPPIGSSRPIDPAEILRAAGKSEDEIAAIAKQADYFYTVDQRLA